jgi:hypothetical protein
MCMVECGGAWVELEKSKGPAERETTRYAVVAKVRVRFLRLRGLAVRANAQSAWLHTL